VRATTAWGLTPKQSVEDECGKRGRPAVVAGCIALLEARAVDPQLIVALGGPPARWALTGEQGGPPYWLRVWSARGLLWAWEDEATEAIIAALCDDSWRVREMALKVVARHKLGDALPAVAQLQDDEVARVRATAVRALAALVNARA
jgi:HEAT repeat protein